MLRRMDVKLTRRHILVYEYVTENLVERRAPHREAHIALIRERKADGRILMAGAIGDPPHGAQFVFAAATPDDAEAFVAADPYVPAGLVASWRVEVWNVVS